MMPSGILLKATQAQAEPTRMFSIIPDPDNDLAISTRAIRCAQAGSLVVNSVGGDEGVTVNFTAGETRDICVTRVLATAGVNMIEGMA